MWRCAMHFCNRTPTYYMEMYDALVDKNITRNYCEAHASWARRRIKTLTHQFELKRDAKIVHERTGYRLVDR